MNMREIRLQLADAFDEVAMCSTAFGVAKAHASKAAGIFEKIAAEARALGVDAGAYEGLAKMLRELESWDGSALAKDFVDFSEALKR